METATKTNREIMQFISAATMWQQIAKEAPEKFRYAIGRNLKNLEKEKQDYTDKATDINIDCSSSDEKGNVIHDSNGNVIFSKEESKKRNKLTRELLDTPLEIQVYFAKQIPTDLTPAQLYAFEGFVIPEIEEPKE